MAPDPIKAVRILLLTLLEPTLKQKSYRSINKVEEKINIFSNNLVTLKNDTKNIIEYVEPQKNKNKKKYHFLDLLKND